MLNRRSPDPRIASPSILESLILQIPESRSFRSCRIRTPTTPGSDCVQELPAPFAASEDFSLFAAAWGVPAVFWVVGGIDPDTFVQAEKAGKLNELPVNHSPDFAPVTEPTLRVGIEAMLAAAGAWLRA